MNPKQLTLILICSFFYLTADAQVNLQTGAAQFDLPIFSYSDQNRLSTAVSLNYFNGNGLKVNEVASEVGTGWQLLVGGVITREQRGLPDDQRRNQAVTTLNPIPDAQQMTRKDYLDKYYPNGYLYTVFNPTDILTNEAGYVRMLSNYFFNTIPYGPIMEKEIIAADREQDIFRIEIGGAMIEFVIDKNFQARILNDHKFKIQIIMEDMYASMVKTTIGKFIVTDPGGIQYVFSSKELSQTCTYDIKRRVEANFLFNLDENYLGTYTSSGMHYPVGTTPPPSASPTLFCGKRTGNFIINKWHLTEIINPATGKKIVFSYETYDVEMHTQRKLNYFSGLSVLIEKEILKALRLIKITCPEATEVNFVYENIGRVDVPGKNPLKEINLKKEGIVKNKFIFSYQYFFTSLLVPYNYSFTPTQKFLTRLCLSSVQKTGSDNTSEPPYLFDYYTGNVLYGGQAPNDILYSGPKDIVPPMFSYFTDHWGYYNNLLSNRPVLNAREGPVNYVPIEYYEECTKAQIYKQPVNGLAKNGILKIISYPMGGTLTYEYEQNIAFHNVQNITMGGVRVSKIISYDGNNHSKDLVKEVKYLKQDNISSSGWGYEPQTYQISRPKRIYKQAQGKTAMSMIKDFATSTISSTLSMAGRLGISISSAFNTSVQNGIAAIIISIIIDILSSPPAFVENNDLEYSNYSLESSNPLPFLYSRVEVIEKTGSIASNGKTVYEFTSNVDLPLLVPVLTAPYSKKERLYKTFYGLPKKVTVSDVSGVIQKETFNEYELINTPGTYSGSMAWLATKFVYDEFPSTHTAYLNQFGNVVHQQYINNSYHVNLKSSKDRLYKNGTPGFVETINEYTYNLNNLQLSKQKTTDSKGSIIETKNYYPKDYNFSAIPVLQSMVNANMLNMPVAVETWKTKPGLLPELLSASVTEYGLLPNGDYGSVRSYGLETDRPLHESVIGLFNANNPVRNSTYIKPQAEITYDINGNVIQTKAIEANSFSNIIYGYNNSYAIATVSNAKASEVAYNSFEENLNAGGWIVSDAVILQEQSPTGKSCLNLTAGSISTSIPINKNYTLSYWATNPFAVNGLVPAVTGPSINGWTYYEYKILSGAAPPSITGTGKIDELRLYPQNSKMVSTTYNPGVGKTSECDINNRITYYEYDGMGRPAKVFDEKRNLIKTFEYHYKN